MSILTKLFGSKIIDRTDIDTEEVVIRYKEFYFMIDFDKETGEPYDWGWSRQPMTHVPIRDFWIARKK